MSKRRSPIVTLTLTLLLASFVVYGLPAKAQQLTPLYNFCSLSNCTDGEYPEASLIQASDGNFYGTTLLGGQYGQGTVFKVTTTGSLTTLYSFCKAGSPCTDGAQPSAGVTQGSDGNFYGTTLGGGNTGTYDLCGNGGLGAGVYTCGTLFKLTPTGELTTLYTFCSQLVVVNNNTVCADGSNPITSLIEDSNGNFYGTANGGTGGGPGIIFELSPEPEGGCPSGTNPGNGYCQTVIYNACQTNGCGWGPSALIPGPGGTFYGAMNGGIGVPGDDGTLFQITPDGVNSALTTLYYFCAGGTNCPAGEGADPWAVIQGSDGNLYGTTFLETGGGNIGGSVFQFNPNTMPPIPNVLYTFCSLTDCADGQGPSSGVIQGSDGNFFGMTVYGGNSEVNCGRTGCGTVFKVTSTGTFTILHVFCSEGTPPKCADGTGQELAGLVEGSDFNFYGIAGGGTNGVGIFFKLVALPIGSFSPTHLTFASQDLGTTSVGRNITLTNKGQETLVVSSVAASGDFSEKSNCASVAVGASCTIKITFSPTETGTRTGTLTITDNNGGVTGFLQTVPLTGTGANPGATLSPTSLSFGNQAIDTTSAQGKITLTSSGTTSLTGISITVVGANPADFTQTNDCPTTLKPNAKCFIGVTFTPTLLAPESASLQVSDNATNSPQTVALTGTGEAQATLTPASYTFPKTKVGDTSAAHAFTLKNNLSTTLTGISYSTAAPFAVSTSTCGTTLNSKASCTISVTFSPTQTSVATGALTVSDSANNTPQTATLAGTGD